MDSEVDARRFGEAKHTLSGLFQQRENYSPLVRDLLDSLIAADERLGEARAEVERVRAEANGEYVSALIGRMEEKNAALTADVERLTVEVGRRAYLESHARELYELAQAEALAARPIMDTLSALGDCEPLSVINEPALEKYREARAANKGGE